MFWGHRCFRILRGLGWQLVTDVSVQPIGYILKGKQASLHLVHIQEERWPQLHCGGSLTPRTDMFHITRHIWTQTGWRSLTSEDCSRNCVVKFAPDFTFSYWTFCLSQLKPVYSLIFYLLKRHSCILCSEFPTKKIVQTQTISLLLT